MRLRHKITEPYAQIPTEYNEISNEKGTLVMSQNNRALRSNPNAILQVLEELLGQKPVTK